MTPSTRASHKTTTHSRLLGPAELIFLAKLAPCVSRDRIEIAPVKALLNQARALRLDPEKLHRAAISLRPPNIWLPAPDYHDL